MNVKDRLSHGFFFIFSGKVGGGLLTILITPVLVRILGTGGYGDYAFAMAVYSGLRTVAGGGVYEGARKYIAETPDPEQRSSVFHFYLRVSLLFGTTVAVLLAVVTYVAVGPVVLEFRLRNYLYLVAVLVFFHAFYHLVRSSLMGFKLERFSEPLYVLNRVFFALIGLPLAYAGFHVSGALAGHAVSTFLLVLVGSLAVGRYTSITFRGIGSLVPDLRSVYRSPMFRYGLLNVVFVLLAKSLYTVDILLLQPFAGSEQVGFYRASLVVAEFLWFVPLALQVVLLHSTSQLWAEGRIDEITDVSRTITRYTLLLTGLMAITLATVGDSFLPIYFGSGFTASYLPLLLLLPGAIGFAVARPIYGIGQGHGNMRPLVAATAAAALVNLLLNLLLIPEFGMYGAAVATSIGYGSMLAFHVWSAVRIGFNPVREIRFGRIVAACGVTFPVLLSLDQLVPSDGLTLVVVPVIGTCVFVLAAWALKALTTNELSEIREYVTNVR